MYIKKILGKNFPRLVTLWRIIRISRGKFSFSGWGMYTDSSTIPPWNSIIEGIEIDSAIGFKNANSSLEMLLDKGDFNLSQFSHLQMQSTVLEPLSWRHYIVYWSALNAAKSTREGTKNLVEVGTCDGLTAYFAMSALTSLNLKFECHMYDAWESMKKDDLLENEKSKAGMYHYLNLGATIRNLKVFSNFTTFNKGYITNSFSEFDNPCDITWLHIDLNAALPTKDSLEYFYERMLPGGIVLFDDYGFHDHGETKKVIDSYFRLRNVSLLQLPTGQAIVIKI